MRRLFTVLFLASFVAGLPAQGGQQSTSANKGQKPATEKDTMKPSTIVGCVAQSDVLYRLDHAVVGTDPDVDTQNRPSTEANATPKMMSYTLVGSDLKAHVGHKVEVTGTLTTDKTSKAAAEIKGMPGMKLVGTLNVKSLKMVANTCP